MNIADIFFYLFAGLAIVFSLLVVLKKNPVSSAFSLVMVFFCFGAIYALMGAHLVAALQVLVYAGAVMVLFVFVIMLLNADGPSFDLGRSHAALRYGSIALTLILVGFFVYAFRNMEPIKLAANAMTDEQIEAMGGNTRVASQLLFSKYILPFELTSVLLLGGIVGAVTLAKRKLSAKAEEGKSK
jgi:NADH-quinone oxidoreductase subunit J